MNNRTRNPVVHLELHTGNLARACDFYTKLFGWRSERIHVDSGAYQALDIGTVDGGVVECGGGGRSLWLPYVEVKDVAEVTEHARELGAGVPLEPREGPVGWRSVLSSPSGGEIALWQPKS